MSVGLNRRDLIARSGLALGAAALPLAVRAEPDAEGPANPREPDWNQVRSQWSLAWDEVDLAAMLIAANPRPVRLAIERHRRELDARPITYLEANNRRLQNAARAAAGAYFGAPADMVALCESTTSGIGLLYAGLRLGYGDEVVTTVHDYYVTHEALRLATRRSGANLRKIELYDDIGAASADDMARRVAAAVTPRTRAVALTWVHSSTGLKMPIRAIADRLAPINASRSPDERVLLCVDGVHGFGVENTTLAELGCDFLVASGHKWLFGPRGTGVILGADHAWPRLSPTIPSFLAPDAYSAWIGGYEPGETTAARLTPGGFKAFEHVWALSEAFGFHQSLGKDHVEARTHQLAAQLKSGLEALSHVRLVTPRDPRLSSGIVTFDVEGMSAQAAVSGLRRWRVLGTVAPYARPHVRLTPSIRNTPEDIDFALRAVAALSA